MLRRTLHLVGALLFLVACGAPDVAAPIAAPAEVPVPLDSTSGRVAYILRADVWIKPLPDGEALRLTADGLNTDPLWSSSGRFLAYRKDIELITYDTVSGVTRSWASPVKTFAWSPDEDRLAYVSGSGILRLAVVDLRDGSEVTLIRPEVGITGRVGDIAWRPDGRAIAYEWSQGRDSQGLYLIPSDGGTAVELYASGIPEKGEALLAGWSGDGGHLLFWQGPIVSASQLADGVPLYALPVGGGSPEVLSDVVLYHDDFVVPVRGGSALALVEGAGRGIWTGKRLVVTELTSGETKVLSLPDQAVAAPSWSPDGTQVAYVAMADEGDLVGGDSAVEGLAGRRIWVSRMDGGEPVALTGDPAYRDERPLWSAD
ncbi:MAG: hypothetical protein MUF84_20705, partial [Anaerolineae bacterium]|nr:hypothetical protein [Anaerolineae bacterium]